MSQNPVHTLPDCGDWCIFFSDLRSQWKLEMEAQSLEVDAVSNCYQTCKDKLTKKTQELDELKIKFFRVKTVHGSYAFYLIRFTGSFLECVIEKFK